MSFLIAAYEMLELEPGATHAEVRRAYRELAMVWHPDRFPRDSRVRKKVEKRLQEINDAFSAIEKSWRTTPPPTSPPPPPPPAQPSHTTAQQQPAEPNRARTPFRGVLVYFAILAGGVAVVLGAAIASTWEVLWVVVGVGMAAAGLWMGIRFWAETYKLFRQFRREAGLLRLLLLVVTAGLAGLLAYAILVGTVLLFAD